MWSFLLKDKYIKRTTKLLIMNALTVLSISCLIDVSVPDNKQVMINGGKLSNFPVTRREQYGQVIEFVYCEIK